MNTKIAYVERNASVLLDEKKIIKELNKRNIQIVYFSNKQLLKGKIQIKDPYIVSAGLSSMKYIFSHFGIDAPLSNSYPKELSNFYDRKIEESTLQKAVFKYEQNEDFFIKPKNDFKSFTGFVMSYNYYFISNLIKKFKPNYPIFISSLINIKSEHRVYVKNNDILETSYYYGEEIDLDMNIVKEVINILSSVEDIPSAYTIDFAITENNKTVVLELNEGFSIDSYNISSENYFKIIKTRWDELYNGRDN